MQSAQVGFISNGFGLLSNLDPVFFFRIKIVYIGQGLDTNNPNIYSYSFG